MALAAVSYTCAAWALDPALARFAHSDAAVITGINVGEVRDSPFGRFLLDRISAADSRFERVFRLTGFDPRRDLHEILIVADSLDSGETLPVTSMPGTGVVAVKGNFDVARWTELVATHGAVSNYNGHKLLSDGQSSNAVAFLDGVFVAGPDTQIRKAIDSKTSPKAANPEFLARVNALGQSHHVWVLSNGSPSRLAGILAPNSRNMRSALNGTVVQSITDVAFGLHFADKVTIAGEATTRSADDAKTLADVARFFVDLTKSNGTAPGGLTNLLLSLDLKADGKLLRFSMSAPEKDFERLFDSGRARIRPVALN
jgi:hypothetical protein